MLFIKIAMLLIFCIITVCVGLYFKKRISNVNDFVLGGRNVGAWVTALSYGATYFSAVVFVGFAGQFGWRFGNAAVWIGLGNAFIGSTMAWFVLGRRTRIMTNHLQANTMPSYFGERYKSTGLRLLAAVIVFVWLIPYSASLFNGLSRLFEMGLGVSYEWSILAMGVITAVYVVMGGYFASAFNDTIQGTIQVVTVVVVIGVALHLNGGFNSAVEALSQVQDPANPAMQGTFTSLLGPAPIDLLAVVILTSLGTWGLPQMVARFYSLKSEKMITKGAIVTTFFGILMAGGAYFLGSFGRLYADRPAIWPDGNVGVGNPVFDRIVPEMLSDFNELLIGLVVVMCFAASISTLSSLVISSSSCLTLDFIKVKVFPKMNSKEQVIWLRMFVVVFIMISCFLAIINIRGGLSGGFMFIAQMMGVSWGAMAGAFIGPFLWSLYWKKTTKLACYVNMIWCSVIMLANVLWRSSFPEILRSPINLGAFCMLLGLVLVPLISLITKPPAEKHIEHCFSCFDPDGQSVVSADKVRLPN